MLYRHLKAGVGLTAVVNTYTRWDIRPSCIQYNDFIIMESTNVIIFFCVIRNWYTCNMFQYIGINTIDMKTWPVSLEYVYVTIGLIK